MLEYSLNLEFHDLEGHYDYRDHRAAYETLLNSSGLKFEYYREYGFGVVLSGTEDQLVTFLLQDQEFWNGALPGEHTNNLTAEELRENIFDQQQ